MARNAPGLVLDLGASVAVAGDTIARGGGTAVASAASGIVAFRTSRGFIGVQDRRADLILFGLTA